MSTDKPQHQIIDDIVHSFMVDYRLRNHIQFRNPEFIKHLLEFVEIAGYTFTPKAQ